MKPFKTFSGAIVFAIAFLFFTSCSKNIEESEPKGGHDVVALAGAPGTVCAPFIGLQVRNNAGGSYFFVNARTTIANQQPFDGTSFPDPWLMTVSDIEGGTVKEDNVAESIGITSGYDVVPTDAHSINLGETLSLKLGSSMLGEYYMRGVDLQFHGVAGATGEISFYRDGVLFFSEIFSSSGNQNFGYSKFFNEPFEIIDGNNMFFDEVRLTCYTGRFALRGRTNPPGLGYLPATRFYLFDPGNQIVMTGGATANLNFVYRIIDGEADVVNRQTFTGTSNAAGWTLSGAPNRWLNIAASSGEGTPSLSFNLLISRWGVYTTGISNEQRYITGSEKVTITKGADITGFNKFAGMEIRAVYLPSEPQFPLSVSLFNGATLVGSFQTELPTGILFNVKTVYFPPEGLVFDRVEITGTGTNASIGGGVGASLRFYPACN